MAESRFSIMNKLGEDLYMRSDGTRTYFFSTKVLGELFAGFKVLQNILFEKHIENVKEEKLMDRVFVQAKFQKE
jgi:methyltransferase-like protein 6